MGREAALRGLVFSALVGWTVAVAAQTAAPAAPTAPAGQGAAVATPVQGGQPGQAAAGRQGGRGGFPPVVIGPRRRCRPRSRCFGRRLMN